LIVDHFIVYLFFLGVQENVKILQADAGYTRTGNHTMVS